jgi:hypothetical protein
MNAQLTKAIKEAHDAAAAAIALAAKSDDPKAQVVVNLGQRYVPRLARLLKPAPEPKVPKSAKLANGKATKSPKVVVAKPRAKRAPVAVRSAEAGDPADA